MIADFLRSTGRRPPWRAHEKKHECGARKGLQDGPGRTVQALGVCCVGPRPHPGVVARAGNAWRVDGVMRSLPAGGSVPRAMQKISLGPEVTNEEETWRVVSTK